MSTLAYRACETCDEYREYRKGVLAPAIAEHCTPELGPAEAVDRFMTGVHERHLSGLPIMPEGYVSPRRAYARLIALMSSLDGGAK